MMSARETPIEMPIVAPEDRLLLPAGAVEDAEDVVFDVGVRDDDGDKESDNAGEVVEVVEVVDEANRYPLTCTARTSAAAV